VEVVSFDSDSAGMLWHEDIAVFATGACFATEPSQFVFQ
jgi:hypothetical protein